MREGDIVRCVETDWHSAYGAERVLERGMRLHVVDSKMVNGLRFLAFDELEEANGDTSWFMESGFRPERLN